MIPFQRDKFDIPDGISYLNCGYMGPQLKSVSAAGIAGMTRKATPWVVSPADFFTESEEVRGLFAKVIGARTRDIAIIPSASYGIAVAAANLPVERGQRIVVIAEQFPSNVYQWREVALAAGAEVVTVARPDDWDWTTNLLATIDSSTAVVAVPECHWTDGSVVDLAAVGRRCREVGAALVVDGTQSVGTHAFDLQAIRPDFLVTAAYKWLLGPYSMAFLYADERHHGGTPIEHNWITRRDSEDFAGLTEYRDEFQAGARRFDVGERSNFVLVPMARAALAQILDWGVVEIEETVGRLTDLIETRAEEQGLVPVPASRRRRHLIGVGLPESGPADLVASLAEAGVYVSRRGRSIRISPHVYNSTDDVERLFAELGRLIR